MIIPTSSSTSSRRVRQHSLAFSRFTLISISQVIVSICILFGVTSVRANAEDEFNPTLEVGVVQQFGKKTT